MKGSFFDIIRRILFWKSTAQQFRFGSVEAACIFVPTAEKQTLIQYYPQNE